MFVVECFKQAGKMGSRGKHDKHMEDLMGTAPNVEPSGLPSLWYSRLMSGQLTALCTNGL